MNTEKSTAKAADTARLASMIGLCRRANRLGCGTEAVYGALKTGRAHLVLLASDASERTRRQTANKCTFYKIPLVALPVTKEELGRMSGGGETSACAVTDPNFAQAISALAGTQEI
ncbi:MAG: 50S ribosomal protein L7ae [Ruminococcaceae bacterium]|nr:50S ribosomal protein L7ae [Oscillospiraceae bacterium]